MNSEQKADEMHISPANAKPNVSCRSVESHAKQVLT